MHFPSANDIIIEQKKNEKFPDRWQKILNILKLHMFE